MTKLGSVLVWFLIFGAAWLFFGVDFDASSRRLFDYGAPRVDLSYLKTHAAPGESLEFESEAMGELRCHVVQITASCPEIGMSETQAFAAEPIDFGTIVTSFNAYGRERQRFRVVVPTGARSAENAAMTLKVHYQVATSFSGNQGLVYRVKEADDEVTARVAVDTPPRLLRLQAERIALRFGILLAVALVIALAGLVGGGRKGLGWRILVPVITLLFVGLWSAAGIYVFVNPVGQLLGWPAWWQRASLSALATFAPVAFAWCILKAFRRAG